MRHFEKHTYHIYFDIEHFRKGGYEQAENNICSLQNELRLLKGAWPNAMTGIHFGQGGNYVSIGYENVCQCQAMAEDAAEMFRRAVKRHEWWREVNAWG